MTRPVNILFIAPLPPPVSGHSIASERLLRDWQNGHHVEVVDFNRKSGAKSSSIWSRVVEIWNVLIDVKRRAKHSQIVYLTISESVLGNFKDLCIYWICRSKLQQTIVHLHGGSLRRLLLDKYPIIKFFNTLALRNIGAAVVLGDSHRHAFKDLVVDSRVYIVPNSAEVQYFLSSDVIKAKFDRISPIKVLFLSNLLEQKGYLEVLNGFKLLSQEQQAQFQIDFAGRFDTDEEKIYFLKAIAEYGNVSYHGVVSGAPKLQLLSDAHVFLLPSSFLEGQPISILEAYASGLVVCATPTGGIPDVFKPGINGFGLKERSAEAVHQVFLRLLERSQDLYNIAKTNSILAAQNYREKNYLEGMARVLNQVLSSEQ